MPNTRYAGIPYPGVVGVAPNGPQQMQDLAVAVDKLVAGRFPSTSVRDSTITAGSFTPSGIPEGTQAYVTGIGLGEYDGSSGWVPLGGPRIASDRTYDNGGSGGITTANTTRVAVTNVHNQLCRMYRARICEIVLANIELSGTAGDLWFIEAGIDGTIYINLRDTHGASGGPGDLFTGVTSAKFVLPADSAGSPHRLSCYVSRKSGAGTTTLEKLQMQVNDLGPAFP